MTVFEPSSISHENLGSEVSPSGTRPVDRWRSKGEEEEEVVMVGEEMESLSNLESPKNKSHVLCQT